MAAVAATICSLLIAATLLELCNLVKVVHCDVLQSSCSARSPVTLLENALGGICMVNKESDIAIRECIAKCQGLSFALGILSSSDQCNCSNDTIFDLHYCCTDIQCDIACERLGQQCNQETHQCEFTVPRPVSVGCHTTCRRLGYGGYVHTGSTCTCTDCLGITNVTPQTCAVVSSALLGVSAATLTEDGTCVVAATVGVDAIGVCDLVNRLGLPL